MRGLGAWSGVEPYLYLSPSFSRIVLLRAYVPFGVTTFNFFVVLFCFVLLFETKTNKQKKQYSLQYGCPMLSRGHSMRKIGGLDRTLVLDPFPAAY